MTTYAYRYTDEEGEPLAECPGCAHNLREAGEGVKVEFVRGNGQTTWTEPSHLDDNGYLVDLGAVARGFHSRTLCYLCEEALVDFDDVVAEWKPETGVRGGPDACLHCGKTPATPHTSRLEFYRDSVFCDEDCEFAQIEFDLGERANFGEV